ncbi:hypothetical protein [Tibrogargan virus]|uniref:Protein U3 n=1 Tax=Tibrogargan virus (strain CS132) TaxID=1559361 RepID=U3_TIBVC|nr:hypothetical protein [Tibrogargan virus]D8V077.1 RecName: Full=Protein U3 [Tibrogargan virus strain CS132]ADG86354.1 hypothetical protein [Tibrogargan virus]
MSKVGPNPFLQFYLNAKNDFINWVSIIWGKIRMIALVITLIVAFIFLIKLIKSCIYLVSLCKGCLTKTLTFKNKIIKWNIWKKIKRRTPRESRLKDCPIYLNNPNFQLN